MKQRIMHELRSIENQHNIKIILACESGSRAWGFPSSDSDYDVRFIYAHQTDWYLTIGNKKDVIELPIDDVLDINGWDLRKALQLMRKSNSPLLEWLSSPIQYHIQQHPFKRLHALSKTAFMPETSCYHYLSMAKKSIAKLEGNTKVRLKTYMYAIRPVLCCEWIVKKLTQPPMRMADLLSESVDDDAFKEKVLDLIEKKRDQAEHYTTVRSDLIDNYINQKIHNLQGRVPKNPRKPGLDEFDDVFKTILADLQS